MKCAYKGLYELYVNTHERTIGFGKCCVINDCLDFGKISFEDFYSLADPWEFIKFKYSILPNGHCTTPPNHTFCKDCSKCDWRDIPLDAIRVNINSCNLNCIMCNNDHSYDRESMEMYWHLLNMCKNRGLKQIIPTTGGEPFLQKNKMVDYICSLTKADCEKINIISNATLLDADSIARMADAAKNNGIELKIQVSIDSCDPETYMKIRGATSEQYNKVMANIMELKTHGILSGVNIVMMPENKDTVLKDIEYWKENDIWVHVLPIRYDNGVGADQIKELITEVKEKYPQYYGDA